LEHLYQCVILFLKDQKALPGLPCTYKFTSIMVSHSLICKVSEVFGQMNKPWEKGANGKQAYSEAWC